VTERCEKECKSWKKLNNWQKKPRWLLLALLRLGWLGPAGFTRAGQWNIWLSLLLPLVYTIASSVFSMTGKFDFSVHVPAPAGVLTLFILVAAFLEEVVFRGLILYAFVREWGGTNRGLIGSVLVSSIFFGGMHILDFLSGRPLPNVLLQSIQALFLGIILGTILLVGKSIYPAAFFHGILNLIGYLTFGNRGLEPEPVSWMTLSLLMLPLALFGILLLRAVPYRLAVPGAAPGGTG
jgi:uncharacterized protein